MTLQAGKDTTTGHHMPGPLTQYYMLYLEYTSPVVGDPLGRPLP